MRSGAGFSGEWLLFPYPPFVLLTYSKYGGGDDPLFVLLKVYIQNIPHHHSSPAGSSAGLFCIPPTLSVRGFIYTVLHFIQTGRSFIKHEENVDFIRFLLILSI